MPVNFGSIGFIDLSTLRYGDRVIIQGDIVDYRGEVVRTGPQPTCYVTGQHNDEVESLAIQLLGTMMPLAEAGDPLSPFHSGQVLIGRGQLFFIVLVNLPEDDEDWAKNVCSTSVETFKVEPGT